MVWNVPDFAPSLDPSSENSLVWEGFRYARTLPLDRKIR